MMCGERFCLAISLVLVVFQTADCFPHQKSLHQTQQLGASDRLPMFTVKGTYSEVGRAVGTQFSTRISQFYKTYEFRQKLVDFSKTAAGEALVKKFHDNVESRLPHLMDELKGLAEGSGQTVEDVFLFHLSSEIGIILREQEMMQTSCSDIFLHTQSQVIGGHNEDNSASTFNTSYIVHATITDGGSSVLEEFTSFCYPGMLCGSTFGFNHAGMVFTTNAIYGKDVQTDNTLPRFFIGRALLGLSKVQSVLTVLQPTHSQPAQWQAACSFSLNLGSRAMKNVINIELCPSGISVINVTNGYYHHFNMFQHLPHQQFVSESSVHREETFMQLPAPSSSDSIRRILGDTSDKDYPIFRNGAGPDTAKTIATAMYDLTQGTLEVYEGNPQSSDPVYTLSIPKKEFGSADFL